MIPVIPEPQEAQLSEGHFILTSNTIIHTSPNFCLIADYLQSMIQNRCGYELQISQETRDSDIIILEYSGTSSEMKEEEYILDISKNIIRISAQFDAGAFYAVQTIFQIIRDKEEYLAIPQLRIKDYPRFSYRGFMLDVGRHYHPIDTIKKILDTMALLKLNIFHWHLTEDQGWRIEIKKYPKLTEIGSKRKDSKIGGYLPGFYRGDPHEGFYTQDEIRDVVDYAQERFIQVIPEIEIPGHCSAALASYPELSCTGQQIEVKTKGGIYRDIYCAGKETTFEFLQDILDEIIEIFPSDVIHIGGDEAPKRRWKKCPQCQERIKNEGLKDEHELQVYFTNRMSSYLKSKGKTIMGWNQILDESLDDSAVVQWWLGKGKTRNKFLRKNRKFVMSSMKNTYLDYNYLMFPLRTFYHFDPIPKELEEKYKKNVIGVEAPLWTEWVPNIARLGWQIFPRLIASSEVAWTKKSKKNYDNFKEKLPFVLKKINSFGIPTAKIEESDPSLLKRLLLFYKWFIWPYV